MLTTTTMNPPTETSDQPRPRLDEVTPSPFPGSDQERAETALYIGYPMAFIACRDIEDIIRNRLGWLEN